MAKNFKESFIDKVIDKIENHEEKDFVLLYIDEAWKESGDYFPTIITRFKATNDTLAKTFAQNLNILDYPAYAIITYAFKYKPILFSSKFRKIVFDNLYRQEIYIDGKLDYFYSVGYFIYDNYECNDKFENKDIEFLHNEWIDRKYDILQKIDEEYDGLVNYFDYFAQWYDAGCGVLRLFEDKSGVFKKLIEVGAPWSDHSK